VANLEEIEEVEYDRDEAEDMAELPDVEVLATALNCIIEMLMMRDDYRLDEYDKQISMGLEIFLSKKRKERKALTHD
jgi:rRNA maturation endonuclease Nob1